MKTIANIISVLFSPFFIPIYGILIFFTFEIFCFYPLEMKRQAFSFIVFFASFLPMLTIFILSKLNVIGNINLNKTSDRILPYFCTILSFMLCTIMLYRLYMPNFITKAMFASSVAILICLIAIILCLFFNFKWKISSHTTAIGCLFGSLLFASIKMYTFPSLWIYLILFAAGLISSVRLYLRKNTESQLLAGFIIGSVSTFLLPLFSIL